MAAMGPPVATSVWGSALNLSLRSIVVFWETTFDIEFFCFRKYLFEVIVYAVKRVYLYVQT